MCKNNNKTNKKKEKKKQLIAVFVLGTSPTWQSRVWVRQCVWGGGGGEERACVRACVCVCWRACVRSCCMRTYVHEPCIYVYVWSHVPGWGGGGGGGGGDHFQTYAKRLTSSVKGTNKTTTQIVNTAILSRFADSNKTKTLPRNHWTKPKGSSVHKTRVTSSLGR